ncbi:LiaF domain-containing protein [Shewanella sp. 4_MG-2023]|uniref:LiaF domain-containing protein n=1 Tax=Shewanella sp. 4_MG-2023 TaxID=3062652 RepID=UPI0026E1ACAF|nr:LiaF domain-containing protein [Shewanella sp. 4_MG-2023]MDO6677007.1 LiaF-related protein [Shewanella sp. 4_MG-2023]
MAVILEDRPIEQVREQVIDQLIVNYSHGIISAEAFERRLDEAMNSSVHQEIIALVADLTLTADTDYSQQKDHQFAPNYGSKTATEDMRLTSILGNSERSGQWVVPKVIKVNNIIGETTLDFSDAIFQHQHVTIEINCFLGSSSIYVPEGINVVCKTYGLVSSIENKAPSIATRQAPVITIEGKVILGSLEVSIKRTIKEKFIEFANNLKSAFDTKNYF